MARSRDLAGRGDWLTLRPDGVGVLDVRATMELECGALVYMTYGGVADLGPDGYQQFLAGAPPPRVSLRIAPRFYTGHPDYRWLNRIQCVGAGEADMTQTRVTYDIYAVRQAGAARSLQNSPQICPSCRAKLANQRGRQRADLTTRQHRSSRILTGRWFTHE